MNEEIFDYNVDEKILYVAIFDDILFERFPINFKNIKKYDVFCGTPFDECYITQKSDLPIYSYESINPIKEGEERRDCNCASFANFIFESDTTSLYGQFEKLDELVNEKIVNRAVFSGNKSIHYRITLQNPPANKKDYGLAWNLLREKYFHDMDVDSAMRTPSHLTRAPEQSRCDRSCFPYQYLLYLSTHTVYLNWENKKEEILVAEALREIDAIRAKRRWNNKKNSEDINKIYSKSNQKYAEFFENMRMTDGCKHDYLPKAIKFWKANPHKYNRSDVDRILSYYSHMKSFHKWGMEMYDYQH